MIRRARTALAAWRDHRRRARTHGPLLPGTTLPGAHDHVALHEWERHQFQQISRHTEKEQS